MENSTIVFFFFVVVALNVVFPTRTAFALDAPTIVPVRLDFDASQAPKTCNDRMTFRLLLAAWVNLEVLVPDADRRLVVRISRSPTGGKLADVTLIDAAGRTLDHDQKTVASNVECHKVLWDAANIAARLMGAFVKPLPPEPVVCPAPPAPPAPPEPAVCPACSAPTQLPPRMVPPAPSVRRGFFGAGVFLGMTLKADAFLGPAISLGFVPFSRWSGFQVEFDSGWASPNTPQGFHAQMVPMFASLCHSHHGLRLCSGLATTFFFAESTNDARENDELRVTLAASLRMGTEFNIAGPFSIRLDAFTLLRLSQRTFNQTLAKLDTLNPFTAGAAFMGVWSFE